MKNNCNDSRRQDKKIHLSGIFAAGYGITPKLLLQARDISATTKLIICYMLTFTGAGRECFPSQKKIAEDLGTVPRTVRRCIKEAQKAGYLNKTRKYIGRGYGSYNEYDLLFMADSPFRQDMNVRSKAFRQDKIDTLDRTREHHKKEHLKYNSTSAKKSIYPDMRPMDES